MAANDGRGRFVWYDLMTTDTDAAVGFYTKVVGWGTMPFEIEGMPPYTMWTAGETPLGGVMALPPDLQAQGVPPHWLSYVSVPDTDAAARQAEQLGGKTLYPPTDIPTVGRFAVIQDPQSGTIALFTPLPQPSTGDLGEPGVQRFSWHELGTTDWRAAFDFYSAMFGWEKQNEHDMGEMGVYVIYGQNGVPYGGMFDKPPQMPVTAWIYYVRVADVNDAVERVRQNGGQVINGPMEVPGGDWIAQCMDPQGGMFAVHQRVSG